VGTHHHYSAEDRHHQDHARELQAERPGWRDAQHGGEDDVRPGDEAAGQTDERGPEEAGYVEEIHGATSRDGF